MGISGLLPFLVKASSDVNISSLSGRTVAVDSYCWLHKGVFGCANKIVMGEQTNLYINYCMKYVRLLRSHNIKVIMVFDGMHLPAKQKTEEKRRKARETAKEQALNYLRAGDVSNAHSYFRRCVNITHEIALELMKECRKLNVDCIVAPYEADAQLAYICKLKLADYVITEDSDLVLFGCEKILYKLDLTGNCRLVDTSKLYLTMGCTPEKFSFDKFRYMCIMSGCDYIDSIPGIGLAKACKFFLMTDQMDLRLCLPKIKYYLNLKNINITDEYIEAFVKADATFRHMIVYNPMKREQLRLSGLSDAELNLNDLIWAGQYIDPMDAFQLSIGNLNPFDFELVDDFNPDIGCKPFSIWKLGNYQTVSIREISNKSKTEIVSGPSLLERNDEVLQLYLMNTTSASKRPLSTVDSDNESSKHSPDTSSNPFAKPITLKSPCVEMNNDVVKNYNSQGNLLRLSKFSRTEIKCKQETVSRFFSIPKVLEKTEYPDRPENTKHMNEEKDKSVILTDIKEQLDKTGKHEVDSVCSDRGLETVDILQSKTFLTTCRRRGLTRSYKQKGNKLNAVSTSLSQSKLGQFGFVNRKQLS